MRVLVTGGAGYVGSISVERLLEAGHDAVVLDTLVTGHRSAVPEGVRIVTASTGEREVVETVLRSERIDAVLHCAARSLVGESIVEPALYYGENVVGGVALLDAMRGAGVERLVFSSTAAVYGEPESMPITEGTPLRPVSPYGETKRCFEGAMHWYATAYGLRCVALRYFNVAGATEDRGEHHRVETHLIPNILSAALGRAPLTIFGTDYPTQDGTGIRDYLHVRDLADAHLAALELTGRIWPASGLVACNLGSGSGFSVRDVLDASERVVGRSIPRQAGPRRAGDPPVLLASNDRARDLLGWVPRRGTLEEMIGSAWSWRAAHPDGYPD